MNLGGWEILICGDERHVTPLGDLREHEPALTCWCCPREDVEDPAVVVHNSFDRREFTERGESQPS